MTRQPRGDVNRRGFLRVTAGAAAATAASAACAPAAAPTVPAAAPPAAALAGKPAWEEEWDRVVKAAKQEGKLVLVTTVGTGFRAAVEAFQSAFPGITVEHTSLNASAFVPRLTQEREAGIYSFDAMTSTWAIVPRVMAEKKALLPIKSVLFRGDVLDDKVWQDGFERGFLDQNEKWVYGGFVERSERLWVNSDMVKDGEITKVEDLLNPKWKGRILAGDPRTFGGGFVPATVMRLALGDDIIKRVWKDQEAVLSRDLRQMTEFMVRGSYPICIGGISRVILEEFTAQGLGKNLKWAGIDNIDDVGGGSNIVWAFDRAPHPNAAKLFVNWLLTKEGQTIWSKHAVTNSRRVDVAPVVPYLVPTPGKKYPQNDAWNFVPELAKTQEIAKAALN
ncbi:MAG: extracellular solute-binding protein [Chloroflexota bacterium]